MERHLLGVKSRIEATSKPLGATLGVGGGGLACHAQRLPRHLSQPSHQSGSLEEGDEEEAVSDPSRPKVDSKVILPALHQYAL